MSGEVIHAQRYSAPEAVGAPAPPPIAAAHDSGFSVNQLAIGRMLFRHCRPYLSDVFGVSGELLDAAQSFVDEQWERLAPETIEGHQARIASLRAAFAATRADKRPRALRAASPARERGPAARRGTPHREEKS
jgi:hypothetical protein